MDSGGVVVHCPSRLGSAVAVLAAEVPCGDGVFAQQAFELKPPKNLCERRWRFCIPGKVLTRPKLTEVEVEQPRSASFT
jgi:hypothetical protein